jgi:probable rRNA maturation factor
MIDIINLDADFIIDKKLILSIVRKIFKEEKVKGNIEIAFVTDKEIRSLNKKYRKKDKATDVLSFGKIEDPLPQIIISLNQVQKNAINNNIDFEEEILRVLIHGILHLKGMDHIKKNDTEKMFQKQEKYIDVIINKKNGKNANRNRN